MKKKALPVGTMFLILVIALAAVGVGYALWSETLTITGSVQTGEVDVEFSNQGVEECIDINGVLTCPEPDEKANAANCTVEWLGSEGYATELDNGANLLQVTVSGMYPSYHCRVGFDVTSTGNVPVHVWLPEPAGDIPAWVATNFEDCYPNGKQLHQGESTGKCTVDIHFSNDIAPEENSGPYTFGWTILATQFNEDPVAPPEPILVVSSALNFSSTGWGGWSCPSTHPNVVSAGVSKTNTEPWVAPDYPINFVLAQPGATLDGYTYPVFPHYTYPAGDTGIAAHNGGTGQSLYLYLYCSE
jgi:predicted ribosomally synthesized peptide with SipW-like signal peptide